METPYHFEAALFDAENLAEEARWAAMGYRLQTLRPPAPSSLPGGAELA